MRVGDCMTRDVQLASPDDTVRAAARWMAKIDIGILPVREGDRLVGMLTDRDIALRVVGEGRGADCKVRDVMSAEVKYCFEDEDSGQVLQHMGDQQLRRLPVLDRGKRLVGILSLSDCAGQARGATAGQALHQIARPGGAHSQTLH